MIGRRMLGLFGTVALATAAAFPVYGSSANSDVIGPSGYRAAMVLSVRSTCDGASPGALSVVGEIEGDQLEALQTKYEDAAGFLAVIHDGVGPVVVVDRQSLDDWEIRAADDGVRAAVSCVPNGLAEVVEEAARSFDLGNGEFIATGYDAITDSIFVESTMDDVAIRSALDHVAPGTSALVNSAGGGPLVRTVQFKPGAVGRQYRMDDHPPFLGGARILFPIGGGTFEACTTGFYINSATKGTVMVTAGHCGLDGENSLLVFNGDLSETLGTTEGNKFPNPDLTVIDGESYQEASYSWSDWTSSKWITASANPTTAVTYCQFGSFSLRRCYPYDSLSTQFCDPGGCTNNLAHAAQPRVLSEVGDSGGGVFKETSGGNLSARGTHVAGGCSQYQCVSYDHKRQTILNTYDATVVLH